MLPTVAVPGSHVHAMDNPEPILLPVLPGSHPHETEATGQQSTIPVPGSHIHEPSAGEGQTADEPRPPSTSTEVQRSMDNRDEATQTNEAAATSGADLTAETKEGAESSYLRRADPKSLPSYPSAGLTHPESAGAAAALLAASSPRTVEVWHPNPTSAAGAAASLAHTGAKPVEVWKPNPISAAGAAASLAHPQSGAQEVHQPAPEVKSDWPLRGALGAMNSQKNQASLEAEHAQRPRAGSSPPHLTATTRARRDSGFSAEDEAAAHERHTSLQLNKPEEGQGSASNRRPMYPHLEGAARQRAEERLAKIGYTPPTVAASTASAAGHRASDLGSGRRRSASLSSTNLRDARNRTEQDEALQRAEEQKRGHDALLLMNVARKNVEARLAEQDRLIAERRRIFLQEEWAAQATRVAARQAEAEIRDTVRHIDIGGGAHFSEEELRRIAERNVKPVLEDLDKRSAEYHEQQRKKREQELARKLSKGKERRSFFGVKREALAPEGEQPTEEARPAEAAEIERHERSAAVSPEEQRVTDREENVDAVPAAPPERRRSLLEKLTGKKIGHPTEGTDHGHKHFNALGMVRDRVLHKTRDDSNLPGPAGEAEVLRPVSTEPVVPPAAPGVSEPAIPVPAPSAAVTAPAAVAEGVAVAENVAAAAVRLTPEPSTTNVPAAAATSAEPTSIPAATPAAASALAAPAGPSERHEHHHHHHHHNNNKTPFLSRLGRICHLPSPHSRSPSPPAPAPPSAEPHHDSRASIGSVFLDRLGRRSVVAPPTPEAGDVEEVIVSPTVAVQEGIVQPARVTETMVVSETIEVPTGRVVEVVETLIPPGVPTGQLAAAEAVGGVERAGIIQEGETPDSFPIALNSPASPQKEESRESKFTERL
ncbi:hypothetical protein FN846DRAFT_907391 [Sphaerosporella brunnea]|uniref:Eisosome protein 1 n=1 Tax=Sphaerosporella brunnea TaxID=1250544 RepID=A0A5J5EVQ6_9PEZI|nr:hypothetical protein FN846DRAFT_907391 [Sphaerosporella brunnea]